MASSRVARTSLIDVIEVALLSTDAPVHLLWEMFEEKARHKNIDPAGFLSVSMSESRSTENGGPTRWASILDETCHTSRLCVMS